MIRGSIPRGGVASDLEETEGSRAAPTTGDGGGGARELDLMGLGRKKLERTGTMAMTVLCCLVGGQNCKNYDGLTKEGLLLLLLGIDISRLMHNPPSLPNYRMD